MPPRIDITTSSIENDTVNELGSTAIWTGANNAPAAPALLEDEWLLA